MGDTLMSRFNCIMIARALYVCVGVGGSRVGGYIKRWQAKQVLNIKKDDATDYSTQDGRILTNKADFAPEASQNFPPKETKL